ncbi:hypothetical protein TWF696_009416 [Orbilia brochopaga]|uniref:Uncharacterized protein n=1 Tax=Orbilia brochopaga TaxID=3140254 RepID=A0AAV9UBE3_9PEZI
MSAGNVEAQGPSRLLVLPLEIRELIYGQLIVLCRQLPEPDLETVLRRTPYSIVFKLLPISIYYPAVLPKYSLLPVLQTCRQIRTEFQAFLGLIQKARSAVALATGARIRHVMDVEAYTLEMFLSWRELPLPPERPYNVIHELRFNYRVLRLEEADGRFGSTPRFDQTGMLYADRFGLFRLLNHLFNHGPQGFYAARLNGPNTTLADGTPRCMPLVETLAINVSFDPSDELKAWVAKIRAGNASAGPPLEEPRLVSMALGYGSTFEPNSNLGEVGRRVLNWLGKIVEKGFREFFEKFLKAKFLADGQVKRVVLRLDRLEEWESIFGVGGPAAEGSRTDQDPSNVSHHGLRTIFELDCDEPAPPEPQAFLFDSRLFEWGSIPEFQPTGHL